MNASASPIDARRILAEQITSHTITLTDRAELLQLEPGRVVGLSGPDGSGLTRLGLSLLREPARSAPVVAVDTRGWLSPAAAWEMGIPPGRLAVIRCDDRRIWPQALAALIGGVRSIYAELPAGVTDQALRRLAALARRERTGLVLRGVERPVPSGVAHLAISAEGIEWRGVDQGHGRLTTRQMSLMASGKAMRGIERRIEVEDDGTNLVRVVGGLATASPGRAAG